jgi:superfamily II DNA or RNA helicase
VNYAPGTLVRARGREWVVLPESEEDFLVVRPLGGTMQETAGIHRAIENVEPATFQPPSANDLGDFVSTGLLRDAMRFGFRSSAGPFRSFGRLAITPRPYQLVPLLMALKLDPVRLLIADDVGIGKTVEACLIARELLDRGEITRICVLCPPHLAEQWQLELARGFNISAELVLSSTARRLEKNLRADESIFEAHPFTIVSTDFIKSDRRRHDFLRACPEFVIVDEAHTCASSTERSAAQQRHQLLSDLAEDEHRHLVLVTATPHSGNEGAFRSLLGLLQPTFLNLPDDLTGTDKVQQRRQLAAHFVQRRRADLRHFLQRDTPFPDRKDLEAHYNLSPAYRALFDKVLDYARETVADKSGGVLRQRVRWWSALSLLRALASSPAAAAATLTERSRTLEVADEQAADEIGRKAVLDTTEDVGAEISDVTPGADPEAEAGDHPVRRRLLGFAREARKLCGDEDKKLVTLVPMLQGLLKEGFKPIVFCRFINTAEYLADELRKRVAKIEVTSITSRLTPEERAARIEELSSESSEARLLVCTDCLSEGINLQEFFDAVVHYDLSWNPTRHEQRDGRVDRFGQKTKEIRVLTYYGVDNQIDGIVLDVLLRKHKTIRNALGVSVPMPIDSERIVQAVFEGLLLRREAGAQRAEQTLMFEEYFRPQKEQLHEQWEAVADREKRSRTIFAQESIKFDEVAHELEETERAIGSPTELAKFFESAVTLSGGVISRNGAFEVDLAGVKAPVREALGNTDRLLVSFEPVSQKKVTYLNRTHPLVESLATYVLNSALDPLLDPVGRRAGVLRSEAVTTRTVLLLLRLRFHIVTTVRGEQRHLLAEDSLLAAFTGEASEPNWLTDEQAEQLLSAKPGPNVPRELAIQQLESVVRDLTDVSPALEPLVEAHGKELLEAHRRVRTAAGARGTYRIESNPPDVVGIYIFLPIVKL